MKKKKIKANVDIGYLAQLSNLRIAPREKRLLSRQLAETVDYIKILEELKTTGIIPAAQVTSLKNISRPDKPQRGLSVLEALKNAKKKQGKFFTTKRVEWK